MRKYPYQKDTRSAFEVAYNDLLMDVHLASHVGDAVAGALKHTTERQAVLADPFMKEHIDDARAGLTQQQRPHVEKALVQGPLYHPHVSYVTSDLCLTTLPDDARDDAETLYHQRVLVKAMQHVRSDHSCAVEQALYTQDEKRLVSLRKAEERYHADPFRVLLALVVPKSGFDFDFDIRMGSRKEDVKRQNARAEQEKQDKEKRAEEEREQRLYEQQANSRDASKYRNRSLLEKVMDFLIDQDKHLTRQKQRNYGMDMDF